MICVFKRIRMLTTLLFKLVLESQFKPYVISSILKHSLVVFHDPQGAILSARNACKLCSFHWMCPWMCQFGNEWKRCLLCVCVFALVGLSQQQSFTLFLKRHFICLWLSWVFVVAQAFSSSGEQGTARSCRVQAYCGGFSSWRAWALGHSGFRRHGTCSQ